VANLGRLSTQYQLAYRAASAIDQAVEELNRAPVGQVDEGGEDVGRYLASVAGLIDPALAGEIDPEYATAVPRALVSSLGARRRDDPELSGRLIEVADALKTGRTLDGSQVQLVREVANVATHDALSLSREILAS
jgi:hypothetical protein